MPLAQMWLCCESGVCQHMKHYKNPAELADKRTSPINRTRNNMKEWTVEKFHDKNILFFKGKNYIPRNDELRRSIAKTFHNHKTAGHPGELETFNAIQQHCWWPGLRMFVKNYVKGCDICQQFKINRNPSKPAFLPVEGAKST
jgi:hypothetical protein